VGGCSCSTPRWRRDHPPVRNGAPRGQLKAGGGTWRPASDRGSHHLVRAGRRDPDDNRRGSSSAGYAALLSRGNLPPGVFARPRSGPSGRHHPGSVHHRQRGWPARRTLSGLHDTWRAGARDHSASRRRGVGGQGVAELLDGLRSLGVTVVPRPRMHEKVAFIDQTITWQGPLNILSHGPSTELMFRYVSADFRENVATMLLGRDKSGRDTTESRHSDHRRNQPEGSPDATLVAGSSCPKCGGTLRRRNGPYGPFLGCSGYPSCRFKSDVPE